MIVFAKKTAVAIKKCFPCAKVGMAVIGLEINHAHIHLVPLNGVHDLDFKREKLQLTNERFQQIATAISAAIEKQ